MKIFKANVLVSRKLYFVLNLLLSYDNAEYTYGHGRFKNFVGFNSIITTSSEHVTNVTFLVVANL